METKERVLNAGLAAQFVGECLGATAYSLPVDLADLAWLYGEKCASLSF